MSEISSTNKYIQGAALTLFLIVLPLGSWYYLRAGFNYHKDSMIELQTYARLPEASFTTHRNKQLTTSDLRGKKVVASFLDISSSEEGEKVAYLKEMIRQFDDREELIFILHGLQSSDDTPNRFLEFARSDELLSSPQVYFLHTDQATTDQLLTKVYQEPMLKERKKDGTVPLKSNFAKSPSSYPYFVFMDSTLTIKNYYDVNSKQSVTRLVEHVAITLPRGSRAKPEIRRVKEK